MLRCWGQNVTGQIGNGNSGNDVMTPADVIVISGTITKAALGEAHTCALNSAGTLWCWGTNTTFQVANDTNPFLATPQLVTDFPANLVQITAGKGHTCALDQSYKAYCRGANTYGQVGNGEASNYSPVPVAVSTTNSFSTIAAGFNFNCGQSMVQQNFRAFCWGDNSAGQIGDPSVGAMALTPTQVTIPEDIMSMCVGNSFACAIVTGGKIKCWGDNNWGQLGDGTSRNRADPNVAVNTTRQFSSLSCGGSHVCGLTDANELYCWGGNQYGALGFGSSPDSLVPVMVVWDSGDGA
jgi:alpha-tubulin suppressor-like RCC1 family protein